MNDYEKIEEEVKENYTNYSVEEEDPWHHEVEKIIRKRVLKSIEKYTGETSVILNAGSGGENYPTKGKLIHLDLVDTNIKHFDNYIVASVTDIPLEDESVDMVICVGSVINYTDAEKTLKEFRRILKPNGVLILEFERSDSADFLFSKDHHKEKLEVVYDYNNQKHTMIMYGEKYIRQLLKNDCFVVKKKKRFHIASMLANKMGASDNWDYKFIHLDFILYPFSFGLAHNCIMTCVRK